MVRGNAFSHHWSPYEKYQGGDPPRFNRGKDEEKKKPEEKKDKKKKKNVVTRFFTWIEKGSKGQVIGCGQCNNCILIRPREKNDSS